MIRKQHVGKAECTKIGNTHGVENALQMIAFVLHNAGMEPIDTTIDGFAILI